MPQVMRIACLVWHPCIRYIDESYNMSWFCLILLLVSDICSADRVNGSTSEISKCWSNQNESDFARFSHILLAQWTYFLLRRPLCTGPDPCNPKSCFLIICWLFLIPLMTNMQMAEVNFLKQESVHMKSKHVSFHQWPLRGLAYFSSYIHVYRFFFRWVAGILYVVKGASCNCFFINTLISFSDATAISSLICIYDISDYGQVNQKIKDGDKCITLVKNKKQKQNSPILLNVWLPWNMFVLMEKANRAMNLDALWLALPDETS